MNIVKDNRFIQYPVVGNLPDSDNGFIVMGFKSDGKLYSRSGSTEKEIGGDLTNYYTKSEVYNTGETYTTGEVDVISGETYELSVLSAQTYTDIKYNDSTGYTDTQLLNYYDISEVNSISAQTYSLSVSSAQTYSDIKYVESTGYTNVKYNDSTVYTNSRTTLSNTNIAYGNSNNTITGGTNLQFDYTQNIFYSKGRSIFGTPTNNDQSTLYIEGTNAVTNFSFGLEIQEHSDNTKKIGFLFYNTKSEIISYNTDILIGNLTSGDVFIGYENWSNNISKVGVRTNTITSGYDTDIVGNTLIQGSLTTNGDNTITSGSSYHIGDKDTDGTWRFIRGGSDLLIQVRSGGTYITKTTITA